MKGSENVEQIAEPAKRFLISVAIKRNMSRHYKRLEERLECLNLNVVAWETISREFRYLEEDLLRDCESINNHQNNK